MAKTVKDQPPVMSEDGQRSLKTSQQTPAINAERPSSTQTATKATQVRQKQERITQSQPPARRTAEPVQQVKPAENTRESASKSDVAVRSGQEAVATQSRPPVAVQEPKRARETNDADLGTDDRKDEVGEELDEILDDPAQNQFYLDLMAYEDSTAETFQEGVLEGPDAAYQVDLYLLARAVGSQIAESETVNWQQAAEDLGWDVEKDPWVMDAIEACWKDRIEHFLEFVEELNSIDSQAVSKRAVPETRVHEPKQMLDIESQEPDEELEDIVEAELEEELDARIEEEPEAQMEEEREEEHEAPATPTPKARSQINKTPRKQATPNQVSSSYVASASSVRKRRRLDQNVEIPSTPDEKLGIEDTPRQRRSRSESIESRVQQQLSQEFEHSLEQPEQEEPQLASKSQPISDAQAGSQLQSQASYIVPSSFSGPRNRIEVVLQRKKAPIDPNTQSRAGRDVPPRVGEEEELSVVDIEEEQVDRSRKELDTSSDEDEPALQLGTQLTDRSTGYKTQTQAQTKPPAKRKRLPSSFASSKKPLNEKQIPHSQSTSHTLQRNPLCEPIEQSMMLLSQRVKRGFAQSGLGLQQFRDFCATGLGYPRDVVTEGIHRTSTLPNETLIYCMHALLSGKSLPTGEGIWTDADDRDLLDVMHEDLEQPPSNEKDRAGQEGRNSKRARLVNKHTQRGYDIRVEYHQRGSYEKYMQQKQRTSERDDSYVREWRDEVDRSLSRTSSGRSR